jgi:hypothetical protein
VIVHTTIEILCYLENKQKKIWGSYGGEDYDVVLLGLYRRLDLYVETNVSEKQSLRPEDGDIIFIRNTGIYLRVYTAS